MREVCRYAFADFRLLYHKKHKMYIGFEKICKIFKAAYFRLTQRQFPPLKRLRKRDLFTEIFVPELHHYHLLPGQFMLGGEVDAGL